MKPVDWVVLVIALSVGITLIAPLIGQVIHGEEFNETRAKILAGLLASAMTIISLYVGARTADKRDED